MVNETDEPTTDDLADANWAQVRHGDTIFQVRVGGVATSRQRVLLHRATDDDFWSIPGGRLQIGETAAEALAREMREEIDADVEVGGLLCLVENFFEHWPLDNSGDDRDVHHHEVGLYFEMRVPTHVADVESFLGKELAGTEHEFGLEFRWFPRASVAAMDVRPAVLRERLVYPRSQGVASLVQRS